MSYARHLDDICSLQHVSRPAGSDEPGHLPAVFSVLISECPRQMFFFNSHCDVNQERIGYQG